MEIAAHRRILSKMSLILATFCLMQAVVSAHTATTITTKDGINYYVPHIEAASFSDVEALNLTVATELVPFVIVAANGSDTSVEYIKSKLSYYASVDDVYSDYFSDLIYIQGSKCSTLKTRALDLEKTVLSSEHPLSQRLAPGPYFMSPASGSVYKAYRLYDDTQSAFTAPLIQLLEDDVFEEALVSYFSAQVEAAVPVPSRLYFEAPSEEYPLSGVRIAAKDIFHVKGVKTGAGSREYYKLYPAQNESSPSVQKLIDLGAVLVGKVKTSQFANGENPTSDWVEVMAPFNPRGDGWQYCSSSSAGSAVAIASYDWLDAAIGTDTSGSMRFPAAYNGIFGGRQSHGGLSTDGVVPVSTSLDTLGVFTRSAVTHEKFVHAWYGLDTYKTYQGFPKKLYRITNLTTGGFPVALPEVQAVYDNFIDKLAKFLDTTATDLEPSVAWSKTGPVDEPLLVYTNMSYLAVAWWEQVQLLQKPFFADWKEFTGKDEMPNIGPKARASFNYGNNNVTEARYEESLAIKANFTKWWSEEINPANEETCSDAIYVYPTGSRGSPTYRDTYLSPPNVVVNWQVSHAAVYAGLPDYAVPIGQVQYLSRLTGVNETLPLSVSIGAGRGCDWMLAKLFTELEKAGITSPVKTGELAF